MKMMMLLLAPLFFKGSLGFPPKFADKVIQIHPQKASILPGIWQWIELVNCMQDADAALG